MAKHLKLGPKASSFYDPTTQKKVLPGQVVKFSDKDLKSPKVIIAISHRHLVEADSKEIPAPKVKTVEAPAPEPDPELDDEYGDLTVKDILKNIEEAYEIDEEELKRLKKMKRAELVEYYRELQEDEEDPE